MTTPVPGPTEERRITLSGELGARLWLLHRPPRDDAFIRALARRGAVGAEFADVPLPGAAPVPLDAKPLDLPAVPADEFTTFRHSSSAC